MIRLTVEKKLKREDFEIMAPVGSWESLSAAIQGGADSVYFGAGALNMRSASSNQFSPEGNCQGLQRRRREVISDG